MAEVFSQNEGSVDFFVQEIRQTAAILQQQKNSDYADFYAEKLIRQFDALQKAVQHLRKQPSSDTFRSNYHFAKNIHFLPAHKRLAEYYKALRALEEKLGWLAEKLYQAQLQENEAECTQWRAQIAETEYRKQKCLAAIEKAEEDALKGR